MVPESDAYWIAEVPFKSTNEEKTWLQAAFDASLGLLLLLWGSFCHISCTAEWFHDVPWCSIVFVLSSYPNKYRPGGMPNLMAYHLGPKEWSHHATTSHHLEPPERTPKEEEQKNGLPKLAFPIMWAKQSNKPSPSHHHKYMWYLYISLPFPKWAVYGIVLSTLYHMNSISIDFLKWSYP